MLPVTRPLAEHLMCADLVLRFLQLDQFAKLVPLLRLPLQHPAESPILVVKLKHPDEATKARQRNADGDWQPLRICRVNRSSCRPSFSWSSSAPGAIVSASRCRLVGSRTGARAPWVQPSRLPVSSQGCLSSRTVSWFPALPLQTHRADFRQWFTCLLPAKGYGAYEAGRAFRDRGPAYPVIMEQQSSSPSRAGSH